MFSLKSWKRLAPLLLFFLGYSLLFFLWVKTFLYTLPFLTGFLIALAVQPVIGFLQKRLKLPHGPATLAATILALVVLCGGLALLGVLAVREITAFLTRAAQNGFAEFSQPVTDFLNRAGDSSPSSTWISSSCTARKSWRRCKTAWTWWSPAWALPCGCSPPCPPLSPW